ncbi:hypothetical protein EVC45_42410 [Paraburkholderia sp. UYCP14C]|uniref:hypothetical protein n=1 Tax=Paraburkholderia sp. UYCP14C TaxID=2511130 RepID=UPI0010223E81|nr:hypothetical protein [Paraburkholderia sp. UYCP14C]RZF23773.1 hypothetical protein EVC45_42410 [Paraburkholderia sp. UYCP14C]
MEVKLNAPRVGRKDPIECAYKAVRSSAYGAGFVAGENAATARAELFRREMAVVLLGLGDAIAAGEMADLLAWYGAASKVFACGAAE